MGRVSLLVEANTSDAISKISGLGEAIKKAMSGFDSSKLATWEQSLDKQLQSVKGKLNDLKEKLKGLTNDFKAEVPFGANNSISTFKDRLKSADEALKTFKATFKDGYTFGAVSQIDSLKSKLNEAQKAIAALNAEAGKSTNLGANQNAKAKKDEITKTIAAVEQLNRSLAKKPVIGAIEAVRSLEQSLQKLSANVPNYLSPISFSLNALKTQMLELSQVLNSVQQPTWVEPFKTKMQEVVKVLKDIATAYKSVKAEIKQSVGESPVRKEFQLTDRQAQNLGKTTTTFYRMLRKEFQETRRTATETAKAISAVMASINGGGAGTAGGTGGTTTAGTRLGFGEQLFSRMRSNLYSYMTMWFGVAGAIRAANALLEQHNEYLEQGKQYNQQGYNALGELYLKAGSKVKGDEYAEFSRQLARAGNFGSNEEAYNFASFALMSGLSKEDMRDLAPIFRSKVAKSSDQRALMSAISYIKAQYGDQYSAKQISAMILEANLHGPSDIGPTANAVQDVIEIGKALNIPLPDLIALIGAGSGLNKDQRVKTALRAYLSKIREKGLEPVIMAESMGMGAGAYYQDKRTGFYKFTDPEMQKQFEADVAAGKEVVNMEMLMQLPAGRGRDIVREIGGGLRAGTGAMIMGNMGKNPENFNKIQAAIWAIANGDMSKMEESILAAEEVLGSATQIVEQGIQNTGGQLASVDASLYSSYGSLKEVYNKRYPVAKSPWRWLSKFGEGYMYGASKFKGVSNAELTWLNEGLLETAESYYKAIEKDKNFSEEEISNAREAFVNMLRALIKKTAQDAGFDPNSPEGARYGVEKLRSMFSTWVKNSEKFHGFRHDNFKLTSNFFEEAAQREIRSTTPSSTPEPTATARAVKAASGAKTENAYLVEQDRLKDESDKAKIEARAAREEEKAAKAEAKAEKDKAKADAKAEWDSIMGTAVKPQKNVFLQDVFGVASSDMDSNLQAVKGAALNDKWSTGKTGGILGQAFYAYASDKTDAATDKKIIEQLVATLNQGGMSIDDMGNLVVKYVNSVGKQTDSEEARKTLLTFMKEVTGYLKNISDGSDVLQTPITNEAKPRAVPSTARR